MNVNIYDKYINYRKYINYKKHLQEEKLDEILGTLAKGALGAVKGIGNAIFGNNQQNPQQAGYQNQAVFSGQTIDQILVQDVDNIIQKAQTNKSKYAQQVLAALNQLEDDAGKATNEKQQQQQMQQKKQNNK
jgi:hypothetical protein